jgi:excisionase family DNA binding protein
MVSDYLSVSAAARILERGENTIRKWERDGKLPALKTETGARIFSRADVERLAAQLRERAR